MSGNLIIPWGEEYIRLDPGDLRFDILEPAPIAGAIKGTAIAQALAQPSGTAPLATLARGASSALIVLSDATRIARADLILPHLLAALEAGGISPDRVTILIGGGNHRPATDAEIAQIVGPDCPPAIDIRRHDSGDSANLVPQKPTVRGTRPALNRLLFERDLIVTISAVNAHYFAGFGGGRKSIFPGIAGRDGIIANHLLAIDFEKGRLADGVETGRLDGNPLNEDICEIVSRRPPDFSINTLLNPAGDIGALYCGHWLEAHRAACARYLEHHAVRITGRRPWAIVSCGGHPKDIDLIQSHKTIQYASRALTRGGVMLLFARCGDGIGSGGFERFFPIRDVKTLLADIRARNPKNGQTALALHRKTRELKIGLVSEIAADQVRDMAMEPLISAQEGINWLRTKAAAGDGFCIPRGALTLPWEE